MISTVSHLVRLRWALTVNGWRKSTMTLVFSILGLLYFGSMAVFASVGLLTGLPGSDVALRAGITVLLASAVVLAWSIITPFVTGVDATVDPRSFVVYPVSRLRLVLGLLVGTATTPIGALTLLLLIVAGVSWWDHPLAAVFGVLGGLVTGFTAIALAYGITAVLSGFTGQRRVREIVSLVLFVPAMLGGVLLGRSLDDLDQLLEVLPTAVAVLAWTPLGAGAASAVAAAQGQAGLALLHLAVALAWAAAAVALWMLGLKRAVEPAAVVAGRERKVTGDAARPLRFWGRPVTGPVTAIAARCLEYWLKDPRYSASIIIVPLFAVLLWFLGTGIDGIEVPLLLGLGPIVAWMLGFAVSADIAYDHTAFHLHMVSGVRGVDDRRGRALALASWGVPATAGAVLIAAALEGAWSHAVLLLGLSLGTFGTMLGLASYVSARFVYPVPKPGDSPWATPQGATMRIMVVQVATMVASLVVTLPMLISVTAAFVWPSAWLTAVAVVVCLAWGTGALALGLRLGGAWLDRAAPETFAAVQTF